MEEVLRTNPLNVSFKRALVRKKLTEWHSSPVSKLVHVNLNEGMDLFVWNLHKNGLFIVKLMYKHLVNNNIRVKQEFNV